MASKLILKFKDAVVSECLLDQEETTIGRKPENSIHIDNLSVSSKHARVLKIGNKAILEDMGSTNGTLVNGQPVTKHVLKHGDVILVGKHTLTYVDVADIGTGDSAARDDEDDHVDKTMIISPQMRAQMLQKMAGGPAVPAAAQQQPAAAGVSAAVQAAQVAQAAQAASGNMPLGNIQILSGPLAGKSYELSASLTSIGKGDGCRIQVKGFTVGKQAAVITRRQTGYHITFLEGMTRLKVNGETLGDQPRTLKDGDAIELGDTKMEFFVKNG